jgi:phage I-like protein
MTMDAYALYSGHDRLFALRALVGLTGEGAQARTGWIHVAPEGSWEGHPDGAFTLTRAGFESCIYDAERRATPQSVDYEHASLYPTGEPTPAAGYVQRLEQRADGLWALVEFTERAAAMIRAGEYRFCSGVFAFERRDRQTGDVIPCMLDSIALTNRPFIDGQEPIALSQNARAATVVALNGGRQMNMISREAVMAALESLDGKEFAEEQLHALVTGVAALEAAKSGKTAEHEGEEMEADLKCGPGYEASEAALAAPAPSAPMAEAVPPMIGEPAPAIDQGAQDAAEMIMGKLTSATGMDASAIMAALDQNLDAVLAALMGAAAPSAADTASSLSVRLLSQQLGAVKERLAGYEKAERAAADRALDLEVDALVQDGRILPASREQWRTLARTARDQFRALSATLPRVVPMGREATATATASSNATALGDTILDMTDPRVVALTAAMDRAGVQDSKIRATRIREALGKRAG